MDDLIADLHIHSKYSHDSLMSPEKIVKQAKKAGLTCIAITDHDTIRGGIEGTKAGEKFGVRVIVGAEIKTDCGDIIGLALEHEVTSKRWEDVIEEIKDQNGYVVFPHPFRDHTGIEQIASRADLIECWNGRSTPAQNESAMELAGRFSKPVVYGSDAHTHKEIGGVKIRIDPVSFQCRELITARYTSSANIRCSQIVSLIKQGKYGKLARNGAGYLWKKIT